MVREGPAVSDDGLGSETIHAEREGAVWWLHVGDRRWPCSEHFSEDVIIPTTAANLYRVRRARVMVESGWELSVAWGTGTYSSNRDRPESDGYRPFTETPTHVDVAVLWDGRWEPCSMVTASELNDMIVQMATWPSDIAPPSWAIEGGSARPGVPAGGYPRASGEASEVPPNGPSQYEE
jgi:hypothetical protein